LSSQANSSPGPNAVKVALVIPVYNHAGSVPAVIDGVRDVLARDGQSLPIILVDDGSTDATATVLDQISGVAVLTHPRNRGKGAALLTAFQHAYKNGFTHALTMDADGQHDPHDALKLIRAAHAHPYDLTLGQRDLDSADVPIASRKGRDAARFWLRVQTGRDILDSQCGLRIYPLEAALAVPQRFGRYDFETEILARLAWGGLAIHTVPVRCIYFPPATRVTHFRPIIDTLRGVRVNVFLVFRRLLPTPFRRLAGAPAPRIEFGKWWKWATWRSALREALSAGASNAELAMAFAVGIFVGLTPFYSLQTLIAIYLSRRLHLNPLAAVIGSQISIPPLAPLWVGLSYAVGHLLLKGEWGLTQVQLSWQLIGPFLLGNLLVAAFIAVLGLLAARTLLYCLRGNPS
jgi:glycosyltransferase involved in cell wall biosynthesis